MGLGFKSNADGSGGSITSNQVPVIDIDNAQNLSIKEEVTLEKGVLVFDKVAGGKLNLKTPNGTEVTDLVLPESGVIYNSTDVDTIVDNVQVKFDTHIPLSGVTAYHLLAGDLSVSNEVITNGFASKLYTGNGSTQTVTTDIDMITQWGNDASETFGGLVWFKNRTSVGDHVLTDSVNNGFFVRSSATTANTSTSGQVTRTSTGLTLGSDGGWNANAVNYASWNFQTTHRRTGTTNHGKAFTEHYNPFTGFTIIKYEGSGLAGHEIPHSLGRKLDFIANKSLSGSSFLWHCKVFSYDLQLNTTVGHSGETYHFIDVNDKTIVKGTGAGIDNELANQYIMYGWANSYFDESNKLIGNYEIGVYGGTGLVGNKVTTKGKPAWVMVKRLDSAADWLVLDNQRLSDFDGILRPNTSGVESNNEVIDVISDGFIQTSSDAYTNASGGQYLYMVVYDNDSGSGKSKYPRATDTSNIQVNNAIIPFANGVDASGTKVSTQTVNGTLVFENTPTAGKNRIYRKEDGTNWFTPFRERYLRSDLVAEKAGDNPDYFDVLSNTWYSTVANPELVTNGTFTSGTTGWINGAGTATIVNGTLQINGYSYWTYQDINTVVGKKYKFKCSYMNGGSSSSISVGTVAELTTYPYAKGSYVNKVVSPSVSESFTMEFVAQEVTTRIAFACSSSGAQFLNVDNISVYATDLALNAPIIARNYLDTIAYADASGQLTYVEELPKVEYKHSLKVDNFDLGQSWQQAETTNTGAKFKDGSSKFRAAGMTYWNTSGKPTEVSITIIKIGINTVELVIDGVSRGYNYVAFTGDFHFCLTYLIPNGSSYKLLISAGSPVIANWSELR